MSQYCYSFLSCIVVLEDVTGNHILYLVQVLQKIPKNGVRVNTSLRTSQLHKRRPLYLPYVNAVLQEGRTCSRLPNLLLGSLKVHRDICSVE